MTKLSVFDNLVERSEVYTNFITAIPTAKIMTIKPVFLFMLFSMSYFFDLEKKRQVSFLDLIFFMPLLKKILKYFMVLVVNLILFELILRAVGGYLFYNQSGFFSTEYLCKNHSNHWKVDGHRPRY